MRILRCILSLCFGLAFLCPAEAYQADSSSYLVNNRIKPNLESRSKPTTPYTKYASVSFLQDNTKLDFSKGEIDVKTQCASLGYVIATSKCTGAMKPSKLCSAESSMNGVSGAANYTTGCCNSNLYTVASPDACANNSTSLNDFCYYDGSKKYRCSCDRARYPYSSSDNTTCGTGGDFDVSDVCVAPNAQGQNISYYSGCCPNSYQECDASNHEVGLGRSCRVQSSKGEVTKYESCTCATHYDTICSDGKLINVDNVCHRNGLNYTTESNCESLCTKTSETNIDDYLYGNVWHCLYENDGATLKETDEELKGKLCRGITVAGENMGTYTDKALNDCEAQGYTKSEDDCYGAEDASGVYTILRCPNDVSKVWCLDSKYCTGYNVYQIGTNKACNVGANINACLNYDSTKGERCKYKESTYKDESGNTVTTDCNSCWRDGTYVGGCQNYDTSDRGDSNHCCKLGYKMVNGICTPNVCSTQKDSGGYLLYPYRKHPGNDQGTVVKCYEAANNDLGYDVYFGYESCNSDAAKGGLWKAADDNPHRCVCDRTREGRYLPFDLKKYFATNGDISNNYANVGFNSGQYGQSVDCTDSEGSYYGYSACYIGRVLGTGTYNKGMCLAAGCPGLWNRFVGDASIMNKMITRIGRTPVSGRSCINQYEHCKSQTGQKMGDDSACALVVDGCLTGNEEACNICNHPASLVKNSNGLYTAHGDFIVEMSSCSNTSHYLGLKSCPVGYKHGGSGYGSCYKYCQLSNLSECEVPDVLKDGDNVIGLVYLNQNNKVWVMAMFKNNVYKNWNDAIAYGKEYAPSGYENHAILGKGKWSVPDTSNCFRKFYGNTFEFYGTLRGEGYWMNFSAWAANAASDKTAYWCDSSYGIEKYEKSQVKAVVPTIVLSY